MNENSNLQFIDTNVLIYAHDTSAGAKHERAKSLIASLWDTGNGCLSIQVFQEFYVTVVRKIEQPLNPEMASQIISVLATWRVHVPDVADVLEAIQIQQRNKLSFWDSLMICSAKSLGCGTIMTEDLNNGQYYEGVKVMNPFTELH